MKPSTVYTLVGLIGVLVFIGAAIAYEKVTDNSKDLFFAAIGLLTFISIFYSLSISKGDEILKNAKLRLEQELNKKLEDFQSQNLKEKDKTTLMKELENLKIEVETVKSNVDYLNLNKWLFLAVLSYFFSIIFYLFYEDWGTIIQIISFWTGVLFSLIIMVTWFAANQLK